MYKKSVIYYLGAWLPTSVWWIGLVLVVGIVKDIDIFYGILAAIIGPIIAIALSAGRVKRFGPSSIDYIKENREKEYKFLFIAGLKYGNIVGPTSIIGVCLFALFPIVIEKVLTALGK